MYTNTDFCHVIVNVDTELNLFNKQLSNTNMNLDTAFAIHVYIPYETQSIGVLKGTTKNTYYLYFCIGF